MSADLLAVALAAVVIGRRPGSASTDTNSVCHNRPDGVFINNPASCRAFWICHNNGDAVPTECPDGWNFNPAILLCQSESVFPCSDDDVPVTEPPPPTDGPTDAPTDAPTDGPPDGPTDSPELPESPFACPPDGIRTFPVPYSCTTYRFCFKGALTVRRCAAGTLFDGRTLRCNLRSLVDCDSRCPAVSDPQRVIAFGSRTQCDR